MKTTLYITIFIGLCAQAIGAELEPEEALALSSPYCIDMRIRPERDRAAAAMKTKALVRYFGCRRAYVLPLSVKPDAAMIARYARKMKQFRGHTVLTWCTHGARTAMIASHMVDKGADWHSVKGGTLYLETALKLAD